MPEKLEYDLTWKGIKAGTASLEIINYGNKIKIVSTARSAKWVSVFYTVDDRVESTLIKNESAFIGQPLNYKLKIREGRHRRDKEIIFNHSTGKATYINYLEDERLDFNIPANIFDPLSSFYYLRTLDLEIGQSVFIDVFDSKKVWNVEIQILKKERLELPTGVFDTILVKPLMKSEGIFNRKGDILIWLTDDKRHIPVRMQTKVVVGSVVATLVGGDY
ncbi:MAG: DUF3108 domain-containing protein [Nitrospirae bacterium]|nr:DUF3108 domain-containing protein [Nitrospirota bacterium]